MLLLRLVRELNHQNNVFPCKFGQNKTTKEDRVHQLILLQADVQVLAVANAGELVKSESFLHMALEYFIFRYKWISIKWMAVLSVKS